MRHVLAVVACTTALWIFALRSFSAEGPPAKSPPRADTHHPIGWRFTMPRGDPAKGRAVFEKFECYDCHRVRGENFPEPTENAPELSQMGPLHPVEFFAESVINPNAVVPKGYQNAQGKSPMTDFTEKMTLRELIDVSSYIASLKPPAVTKTINGTGKIVAVVPQTSELVIEHGELKGFMDAMTMGYKVGAKSLFNGLAEGDAVSFTIDTEKRLLIKIVKLKK